MYNKSSRKGFTIIELLIVVIVIGILAAAGLAKYQNFAETSRRKSCLGQLNALETGLAVWETNNSSFAENAKTAFGLTTRTGRLTGCGGGSAALAVGSWAYSGAPSLNILTGGTAGTISSVADAGGQVTVGAPSSFYNQGSPAAPTGGPLSSVIRDDNIWVCPSGLSRYYGGEIQNVPDDFMDITGGGVSPAHTTAIGVGGRYYMFVAGRGNATAGQTPIGNNSFDAGGGYYITNTAANGAAPEPQTPFKIAVCGCYGTFGGTANSGIPGTAATNSGGPVGPDGSSLNRHSARW